MFNKLDNYFGITKLGSSIKQELLAGLTTFLTMAYIIVVNPMILADAGIPFAAGLFATVVVASVSSILMGFVANIPIALAPGMGLNAYFAYTLVLGGGMSWQTALAAVFVSGLVFIGLSLPFFNVREKIVAAVPKQLRFGVAAGIGLFLAFIGLSNAGIIVDNPATLVGFSGLSWNFVVFVFGLVVATVLMVLRIRGALLLSIVASSVLGFVLHLFGVLQVFVPQTLFAMPSFEGFLALDLVGLFSVSFIAPVFALLFTDMFDSISTFMGVSQVAGLVDANGEPKNVGKALLVDGISTTLSGLVGSSPGTAYIESTAGVEEGGRTGLTTITTGLLFLPFMFLSPLLGLVPAVATAPILVIVGFYMLSILREMEWGDYENSIPAFIAMLAIPLAYSISTGIVLGFVSYVLTKLAVGKVKQISPMLWGIFALSCLMVVLY